MHFEAPAAARVPSETASFLAWLNGDATTDPLLIAAQAHLWFITIHPFDDGNGRIARAIADLALARSERSSQRVYSMPAQIQKERSAYYAPGTAFGRCRSTSANALVVTRLLGGFEGALTTSKWIALAKCSQDTALRDILQLVERGVLVRNAAGGRSTTYSLAPIGEERSQRPG